MILETGLLTQDEKVIACELAKKAGADFVKTCTGFSGGAASVEDVALMRLAVGPSMGVKASGGIRTYKGAAALVAAGATRLGCTASVAIVTGGDGGAGCQENKSSVELRWRGKRRYMSSVELPRRGCVHSSELERQRLE